MKTTDCTRLQYASQALAYEVLLEASPEPGTVKRCVICTLWHIDWKEPNA